MASLTQFADNTQRHNRVRQVTLTTEVPLNSRQRERVVSPTRSSSRRIDTSNVTGAIDTQNSQRKIARFSTNSSDPLNSQIRDGTNAPNSSRIVKRKKIRVSIAATTVAAQPAQPRNAITKSDRLNKVSLKPTMSTPRLSTSSATRAPLISTFRTSTQEPTSTTELRKLRTSNKETPATTATIIVATSVASKLIGFSTPPTIRRQSTVQPNLEETITEVSQLSTQARRPTTRVIERKTLSTTTKPVHNKPIRGAQRSAVSTKKSPTRAQVEALDDENYPAHYKMALKAKYSVNNEGSNEVSQKPSSKSTQNPSATSRPNSARVTFPKLDKSAIPERIPGDTLTNSFDGPDPNSINQPTYVDYQNSLPKYSSRIRHNENRVQEPSHKVRARSQNLTLPSRNTNQNQLLESSNGFASSSSAASAVSSINLLIIICIKYYIVHKFSYDILSIIVKQ